MASPELSARLRFLNDAAHLLATTAPATSRHLMSRCNSLLFENNIEPAESEKLKACGACGTIMIVGVAATFKVETQKPRSRKRNRDDTPAIQDYEVLVTSPPENSRHAGQNDQDVHYAQGMEMDTPPAEPTQQVYVAEAEVDDRAQTQLDENGSYSVSPKILAEKILVVFAPPNNIPLYSLLHAQQDQHYNMADSSQEHKPDGAAPDDFFESLGNKAKNLTIKDSHQKVNSDVPEDAEDGTDQKVVDEIESLYYINLFQGTTRLLLTRIPFFREIIIMSFFCPHCNFKNAEIQSAGEIQQKGSRYELRLTTLSDFARQVVKSDTCVVKFIELDIEVPAGEQPERKEQIPEVYNKIEEIINKGKKMISGEGFPFRVSLDDPSGNSWIEPDQKDGVGKWSKVEYARTPEQNEALGLGDGQETADTTGQPTAADVEDEDIIPNEVYSFPASCPGCTRPCVTHMKMVDIPHFKQVIIMSTVCDHCGYRSNEVKTGGEVPLKGKIITLSVENASDLGRDILKSESCALECPELSLSVTPGTLGGRFTTVEGLLAQVRDDLHQQIFDIGDDSEKGGDSLSSGAKQNWKSFFEGIAKAIKGEKKFTVVLRDPLASSYVQNLKAPDEDPQIKSEEYERTREEEEELGLADMRTEGYVDEVGNEKRRVENEKKALDEKVKGNDDL
ncbi:hypothetical protein B7494_g5680 [Chlorociboria aeruginascens]|nr:hypothetical protein B7494_g5680 [Chlorociboria aeruginascens]